MWKRRWTCLSFGVLSQPFSLSIQCKSLLARSRFFSSSSFASILGTLQYIPRTGSVEISVFVKRKSKIVLPMLCGISSEDSSLKNTDNDSDFGETSLPFFAVLFWVLSFMRFRSISPSSPCRHAVPVQSGIRFRRSATLCGFSVVQLCHLFQQLRSISSVAILQT
jgi:hypothetical protein